MIELQNITIANDPKRPLVARRSLTLCEGTLTALIGRNGCGKSTLLRAISGEQNPIEGKVLINGLDTAGALPRELAALVAVITTESVRVSNLTCRELVSYGRSPHTGLFGRLSEKDNQIIDESLVAVGMTDFANRKVTEISDGESRRIMLARALAQQTPVILLDEPTSFLDVPGRYEIASLLSRLAHDEHKTILYSTHELDPAFRYADMMLLMHSCDLTLSSPADMRTNPDFTALFNFS